MGERPIESVREGEGESRGTAMVRVRRGTGELSERMGVDDADPTVFLRLRTLAVLSQILHFPCNPPSFSLV